jgi:hypothetical protein
MAFVSRLCNFFMLLILVALITSIIASMYALLPTDPAKRSACLDVVHAFLHDHHVADSAKNLNYQYAVVDLLAEQLQRLHKPN